MDWKPWNWKPWARKNRSAPTSRAELDRFLDLTCPDNSDLAKLRLIILLVILQYRHPPEVVIEHAHRWDIIPEKARELMRGDVEFGFRWYSIEGVLVACGAEPVVVDRARELFHDFPRADRPPEVVISQPPPPLDTPEAPADEPTATPKPGEAELKPDPLRAKTVADLIAAMGAYRMWKGERSYRKMAAAAGGRYVASTFASLSTRTTRPSLDLVLAYIEGCGGDEADLEIWREAWRRIALAQPDDPGETGNEPR